MYNPDELKKEYDRLEHGKAREAGIRHAISMADQNNDLAFQLFFRLELCTEANFYGDMMEFLIVFPEVLALIDKHPDIPSTKYGNAYKDGLGYVLWVYKWVLLCCREFYQIPMEDCLRFFEDFKKRSLAYGYNLKPYYKALYNFYYIIDKEQSDKYYEAYEKIPRDGNADCKACERNHEIFVALDKGDFQKAEKLSQDIREFKLICNGDEKKRAWLCMNTNYMWHYLEQKNFEMAERYCKLIERTDTAYTEFDLWHSSMYCYAHTNMGKALQIYKNHWKEGLSNRYPNVAFGQNKYTYAFFRELEKQKADTTIMLDMDKAFPLYREDGEYEISKLKEFYYQRALDVAQKFDKRNGNNFYQEELENV